MATVAEVNNTESGPSLHLKGLYVTIFSNLHVLITFYWPYVSELQQDVKNETFPVTLGCLYKPWDKVV